jgi:hypothetical protein
VVSGAVAPDLSPTPYINNATLPEPARHECHRRVSSELNLFYAALFNETITAWNEVNGRGTVLAAMTLSADGLNFRITA